MSFGVIRNHISFSLFTWIGFWTSVQAIFTYFFKLTDWARDLSISSEMSFSHCDKARLAIGLTGIFTPTMFKWGASIHSYPEAVVLETIFQFLSIPMVVLYFRAILPVASYLSPTDKPNFCTFHAKRLQTLTGTRYSITLFWMSKVKFWSISVFYRIICYDPKGNFQVLQLSNPIGQLQYLLLFFSWNVQAGLEAVLEKSPGFR